MRDEQLWKKNKSLGHSSVAYQRFGRFTAHSQVVDFTVQVMK